MEDSQKRHKKIENEKKMKRQKKTKKQKKERSTEKKVQKMIFFQTQKK